MRSWSSAALTAAAVASGKESPGGVFSAPFLPSLLPLAGLEEGAEAGLVAPLPPPPTWVYSCCRASCERVSALLFALLDTVGEGASRKPCH